MRPRPLGYVVLNPIHIRSFDMRLQSERPKRIHPTYTSLTSHKRHYSALKQAETGTVKSPGAQCSRPYLDNFRKHRARSLRLTHGVDVVVSPVHMRDTFGPFTVHTEVTDKSHLIGNVNDLAKTSDFTKKSELSIKPCSLNVA
ncbi:hypothetical protein NL108_003872 [Boleophthalmus pectinirostris]|nr:hypothetical protein NL108_003872 [Boleophthalmus pectinirostris]